ncbi:hypothetical protein LEMA_P086290.1 [Plenodomus lingam JN3]|uniref:Avirulence Effector AvrLm4-7 domain-containing protein n=2 Tax=Leptosphaeria maculans TaxID=5022 RepID=E5A6Z5_LEPMJ|nr:hypothetical protein LEMA_P086290.1 [Plenodomus lingam JN3]CAQ53119.1 AvrLm4-7 protein [Plenodomus lingam/Leptosphaeria maculans 'brassicae' group]CBX99390.1 hypothetical protein LEMA_P086290.1 [Plenodomus lingam JN3]
MPLSLEIILTLLALSIPTITACREASISGEIRYPQGTCPTKTEALNDCNKVTKGLIDFSQSHQRAWGIDMTAKVQCAPCITTDPWDVVLCTCKITAHRYREFVPKIPYSSFSSAPGVIFGQETGLDHDPEWVVNMKARTRGCD